MNISPETLSWRFENGGEEKGVVMLGRFGDYESAGRGAEEAEGVAKRSCLCRALCKAGLHLDRVVTRVEVEGNAAARAAYGPLGNGSELFAGVLLLGFLHLF